ncbi:MAG: IS1634 family transposase [Gemmatimonadetes bacterium]|nr:IS1634 family transposase [Gemmatimonadota bacterium]
MHIDIVPNRHSPPAVLLRESYREGARVRKRTLANLSALSAEQVEAIRKTLRGETLVPLADRFAIVHSHHHGHVQAIRTAMQQLGFEPLLASRPSRDRDLIVAMVMARILEPASKLATTRWWHTTTLPDICGVANADADDLYAALDWLITRQAHIEKKLAARHLHAGGFVLYDLSSSYFEGTTCPLAALGYNRDGKRGKRQVNYGLLTDPRGCPVAVSVFAGNTGDPTTVMPQVETLQKTFAIEQLVLVGDRGMISQQQITALKQREGLEWITALRTGAIHKLVDGGHIQLGLFDERNLFEVTHPDFPGERLVACRNPQLALLRAHKRQSLLDATSRELERVRGMILRGTIKGKDAIGVRIGKVVDKYKVSKHVVLDIRDEGFDFHFDDDKISAEAALDGLYVIRTSVPAQRLATDAVVRSYKMLSQVERAFRSLKTIDLDVRPIRHRLEDRVKAHIFLCMLAHHVAWHMMEAWRPLLFSDEDQQAKTTRDPVAPAKRSDGALAKVHTKVLDDGTPVHSFHTLLQDLSSIVSNTCRRHGASSAGEPTFKVITTPSPTQQRAYNLLKSIQM